MHIPGLKYIRYTLQHATRTWQHSPILQQLKIKIHLLTKQFHLFNVNYKYEKNSFLAVMPLRRNAIMPLCLFKSSSKTFSGSLKLNSGRVCLYVPQRGFCFRF